MGGAKIPPPLCAWWTCYGTAFTFHKGTYALLLFFFFFFANFENLLMDYTHSLALKDIISYMTYEVKPQSSGPDATCISLVHKSNVAGFCWFMLCPKEISEKMF